MRYESNKTVVLKFKCWCRKSRQTMRPMARTCICRCVRKVKASYLFRSIQESPRLLIPYKVYIPKVYIPCIPWLRIRRGKQGIKYNSLLFHSRSSSSSIGSSRSCGSLSSLSEHGTQFSSYVTCLNRRNKRVLQCAYTRRLALQIKLLTTCYFTQIYGTVYDSFD